MGATENITNYCCCWLSQGGTCDFCFKTCLKIILLNTVLFCITDSPSASEVLHMTIYNLYYFLTRGIPGGTKFTEEIQIIWQRTLLWSAVTCKTTMQQNRITTIHHNGNPMDQNAK